MLIDRMAGDDMTVFSIMWARTLAAYPMLGLSTLFVIGYGWVLQLQEVRPLYSRCFAVPTWELILIKHPSAPLILQFYIGVISMCIVQVSHRGIFLRNH